MTRRGRTKIVDRLEADGYRRTAVNFLADARRLFDSRTAARSANGVAVLAVHGAIAWCDALCIAYGGRKSVGTHDDAPVLLEDVLGKAADITRIRQLRTIIGSKDKVSYAGYAYDAADAEALLKKAELFAEWANALYQRRPPR